MMQMPRFQALPRRIRRVGIAVLAVIAVIISIVAVASNSGNGSGDHDSLLKGTVHVATAFDQPGFSLHSNHNDRGFDVDIANFLGERIGFKTAFQDVAHAEREAVLQRGVADLVIASYSITPERAKRIDFVGPYFVTRQGFLVRKDYNKIKTEKDIDRKTVCTVEGTTPANVKMPLTATMYQERDYSTCVRKLQQGNVDTVFSDESLLFGYVEQMKNTGTPLKVVPDVNMGLINRYGIGLPKGHPRDCQKLLVGLRSYLSERWSTDVKAQLSGLVETYPGDWKNRFKPDPQDLNTYSSCKA